MLKLLINKLNKQFKQRTEYVIYVKVPFYWFIAVLFFILTVVLLYLGHITTEVFSGILLATIGWIIGIGYIGYKTKQDLEIKTTEAVFATLRPIERAIINASFSTEGTVYGHLSTIPSDYWYNKASEHYNKMVRSYLQLLTAHGNYLIVIENHEIVLVKLWHYYQFVNLELSEYIDTLHNLNSEFLAATNIVGLTEQNYYESLEIYKPVKDNRLEIVCYLIDLRKIIMNEFLAGVFMRKLTPRKPLDKKYKTVQQLATRASILKIMDDKDKSFLDS